MKTRTCSSKVTKCKKIVLSCVLGVGIAIVPISLLLSFSSHSGNTVVRAISEGKFYLEGTVIYSSSEHYWSSSVTENHNGADFSIEYDEKSFANVSGEYYIVDEKNKGRLLSVPEGQAESITEAFAEKSALPRYDYSNLTFYKKAFSELLEQETGEVVLCEYEEYRIDGEDTGLRLYYKQNKLYAIQTTRNPNFTLYISQFSIYPRPMNIVCE